MNDTTEQTALHAGAPADPKTAPCISLVVIAALIVMAAGFWLRVSHMDDPVRNDEAFTYLMYVKRADYFNYSMPNNHILNTLLVSASAQMAGGAPWTLRLPDFLFGLALIPAVGLLCFQLCGSRSLSIAAMALAASSTALVEYSTNARGYSLIACMAAVMACVTVRLGKSPKWRTGWVVWTCCGVAGLYSVPTMLLAILPLTLLLLADRWAEVKQRLLPLSLSLLSTAVITVLLYEPVIATSGLAAITANPYVSPETLGTIPAEMSTRLGELAAMWGASAPAFFLPFLCLGTCLCAVAAAMRGSNRALLLSLLAIAVAIAMAFLQRRVAPARVYLYLQPWMIGCACAAIALLLNRFTRRAKSLQLAVAILLLLLAADNWIKVKRQPLLISEDPHTFVEARQVAAELVARETPWPNIAMLWDSSENIWPPLLYYYIQLRPAGRSLASWDDRQCNAAFILLSPGDNLDAFLKRKPGFSQLYAPPQLIRETANSRVYLAEHR